MIIKEAVSEHKKHCGEKNIVSFHNLFFFYFLICIYCLSSLQDGQAMLWDLNEGKHLYTLDSGDAINALCFSPNRYWLCAATGPSIKIWVSLCTWTHLIHIFTPYTRFFKCKDFPLLSWIYFNNNRLYWSTEISDESSMPSVNLWW